MKKKLFFAAVALVALAGCTSDEYVGEINSPTSNDEGAINFNLNVPKVTRTDQVGEEAASTLGSTFYVYGIKNESSDGAGDVDSKHFVFKNYVVKYGANTAYTTTSNTKDWEYVGYQLTENEKDNITDNSYDADQTQTIKYWDYGADDYTFYAFSAQSSDIESGNLTVAKIQNDDTSVYGNGYTVTLETGASLDNLFFSERVNIKPDNPALTDRTAVNHYGGNVTFRFHNAATKVRVAMYETIDGYSVTINKFSVDEDGADPAFDDMEDEVTDNFAANLTNSVAGNPGTLTVTYYDDTDLEVENHPILSFSPDAANKVLSLGTNLKEGTVLATNITAPTYDTGDDPTTQDKDENGSYTSVFPNKDNTQNLKLKLSYTLTALDTDEEIVVENATAEIPAGYLQWKPGFAYTYIFKISANTNGSTGQGVVGLYPITFDAVATVNEDGLAEYITTVSEPSITTFGVNSSGKYITGGSDYPDGSDIYVTIMEGSSVITPVWHSNVDVYYVTTSDPDNFPINEASVAESIKEDAGSGTKKITFEKITASNASTYGTKKPSVVDEVPGEDGVNIDIDAFKLGGVRALNNAVTYYAIEYTATAAWSGSYDKVYKIIKVTP